MQNSSEISNAALGARLRALREQRGLSLQDVASEIGVSYQQLQKYETGVNSLTVAKLLQITSLIGLEPSVVLEPDGSDPVGRGDLAFFPFYGERHRLRKAYFSLPEPVRLAFLRLIEAEADRRAG